MFVYICSCTCRPKFTFKHAGFVRNRSIKNRNLHWYIDTNNLKHKRLKSRFARMGGYFSEANKFIAIAGLRTADGKSIIHNEPTGDANYSTFTVVIRHGGTCTVTDKYLKGNEYWSQLRVANQTLRVSSVAEPAFRRQLDTRYTFFSPPLSARSARNVACVIHTTDVTRIS